MNGLFETKTGLFEALITRFAKLKRNCKPIDGLEKLSSTKDGK